MEIWTDGACKGNPGPGGWAAILKYDDQTKMVSGYAENTTNNKMELTAVIEGIKEYSKEHPDPTSITIHCDSTYVMMTKEKWMKWKDKPDLPNRLLWQELIDLGKRFHHKISYVHVEAHSGDKLNEQCDKEAKAQARKIAQQIGWQKTVESEICSLESEDLIEAIMKLVERNVPPKKLKELETA